MKRGGEYRNTLLLLFIELRIGSGMLFAHVSSAVDSEATAPTMQLRSVTTTNTFSVRYILAEKINFVDND